MEPVLLDLIHAEQVLMLRIKFELNSTVFRSAFCGFLILRMIGFFILDIIKQEIIFKQARVFFMVQFTKASFLSHTA